MKPLRAMVLMVLMAAGCRCSDSSAPVADARPATAGDSSLPTESGVPGADVGLQPDVGPPATVDKAAYHADLVTIAKPRPPGSAHWKVVQNLCADRLTALGLTVQRHTYASGVNVIGTLAGTGATKEQVIVSAHYDSTDESCPGADDNASGVAGMLEATRLLVKTPHARTLIAACWDEEERGLKGAEAYAAEAQARGDAITLMYSLEMIGFTSSAVDSQRIPPGLDLLFPSQNQWLIDHQRRGDFIALIYDDSAVPELASKAGQAAAAGVGLPIVALPVPQQLRNSFLVGDLRRSDHAAFWLHDFPAMMVTDTSEFRNDNYHCRKGEDTVAQLDDDFTAKVIQAVVASATAALDR